MARRKWWKSSADRTHKHMFSRDMVLISNPKRMLRVQRNIGTSGVLESEWVAITCFYKNFEGVWRVKDSNGVISLPPYMSSSEATELIHAIGAAFGLKVSVEMDFGADILRKKKT